MKYVMVISTTLSMLPLLVVTFINTAYSLFARKLILTPDQVVEAWNRSVWRYREIERENAPHNLGRFFKWQQAFYIVVNIL